MKENRIDLTTGLLLLLVILLAFWAFGCGDRQMFEEVRPGFFLNVSQAGTDQIKDTVLLGLDTYTENFGGCNHNVDIVMKSWAFDCGGLQLAAGCSLGGIVNIGVNHTSECATITVILHELSHECRHLKDDYKHGQPNWTWELNDITAQMFLDGKCKDGTEELYNYVWN